MQKIHKVVSGTIASYVDNLYFTENALKIIEKWHKKGGTQKFRLMYTSTDHGYNAVKVFVVLVIST